MSKVNPRYTGDFNRRKIESFEGKQKIQPILDIPYNSKIINNTCIICVYDANH